MKFISRQIDKRIAAYQRELIDTHYKEVDNMYRQMRGWRHDYRNHIQMLKALAAKGDMNGINDYKQQNIIGKGQGHKGGNRRAYSR